MAVFGLSQLRRDDYFVTQKSKKMFEVAKGESIDSCLERMKAEGYAPVRRIEKPIFAEQISDGITQYEPVDRKIVFEAKIIQ